MNKSIFEKIVSKRTAKGLSKADLARACGITPTAYANIEKGEMNSISLDIAIEISKALNENFNELFDIELPVSNEAAQSLIKENEELKRTITALKEELLNDKKTIIDFLSKNNLLLAVASQLYHDENPRPIKRDFNDIDALMKELDARPYDPGDQQSQFQYVQKRLAELKSGKKD